MSDIDTKSIHELRQIAQNLGIGDVFSKDQAHLLQEISLRQTAQPVMQSIIVPRNDHDHRLLTDKPNKIVPPTEIMEALKPYIALGVHVRFDDEYWFAQFGKKEDTGTIRMPLRDIIACVEILLR